MEQTKPRLRDGVLLIGSGLLFHSLKASLTEAGMWNYRVAEKAAVRSWQEVLQPYRTIMYASDDDDIEEFRIVHLICREEKKSLLPIVRFPHIVMVGPYICPEAEVCWESAWRRIHRSAIYPNRQARAPLSSYIGSLLADMVVTNLIKAERGVMEPPLSNTLTNRVYLLDLESLVGDVHEIQPHPLVTGSIAAYRVHDIETYLKENESCAKHDEILTQFDKWTSEAAGIFHTWGEGELYQLPLALCRVQTADPSSEGPADLLPAIVCSGLTHMEARWIAGLEGLEVYTERMVARITKDFPDSEREFAGVGAGRTFAQAVYRGLRKCLINRLEKRLTHEEQPLVHKIQLNDIEDQRCSYYLRALTAIHGKPIVGLGEEECGCPVAWVYTGGSWYGGVDVNMTLALCNALQQALEQIQCRNFQPGRHKLIVSSVMLEERLPRNLRILSMAQTSISGLLRSVMPIFVRDRKCLRVFDIKAEPFLHDRQVRVAGIFLREECSDEE